VGTEYRANALALITSAPAVLRCALSFDVVVYTVKHLAMWYCRIAAKPPAWLARGARMIELASCTGCETGLDSLNTKLERPNRAPCHWYGVGTRPAQDLPSSFFVLSAQKFRLAFGVAGFCPMVPRQKPHLRPGVQPL